MEVNDNVAGAAEPDQTPWSLIGSEAPLANADYETMLGFYGAAFARLPREVGEPGVATRELVWQAPAGDDVTRHRIALESDRPDLPAGWTRWRLDSATHWTWRAADAEGRPLGGFVDEVGRRYDLTGCAWVLPGAPPPPDDVELVDYDATWPAKYAEFAVWLNANLPAGTVTRLEHYGSTSVPGLPAKPVIDVLAQVDSCDAARTTLLPLCSGLDWEYWHFDGHMTLVKRVQPFGLRCVHLHVAPADHPVWRGLVFRDRLRADAGLAAAYAALKRRLATEFKDDRERYTLAKTDFVLAATA